MYLFQKFVFKVSIWLMKFTLVVQLYSLENLKLGFFITWIRIRHPPYFGGPSAEKVPDPKHCVKGMGGK